MMKESYDDVTLMKKWCQLFGSGHHGQEEKGNNCDSATRTTTAFCSRTGDVAFSFGSTYNTILEMTPDTSVRSSSEANSEFSSSRDIECHMDSCTYLINYIIKRNFNVFK